MRKIIAVSVLGLSLAMFAGAQTPTSTSPTRNTVGSSTREQTRQERQSQIEAKRPELQAKLNNINERVTGHFTDVLNQIDKMLDRVKTRASKAEANGLNVSTVNAEITNAQNAITAARAAVATQAGKVYTVQTTGNETTFRSDVGKTRQALHQDLVAARDTVKAARDAVRKAAVTLAQIPRVDEVEVP